MALIRQKHRIIPTVLTFYLLLLLFGSLHPISTWQTPPYQDLIGSFESDTKYTPKSDLIINLLIYIPFGLLLVLLLNRFGQYKTTYLQAIIIAALVSLSIECLQLFIPSRAQSFVDFGMNSVGAGLGCLLHAAFTKKGLLGGTFNHWRYNLFYRGRYVDLGILVIAGWALSELSPFLPSLNSQHVTDEILALRSQLEIRDILFLDIINTCLQTYTLLIIFKLCLRYQLNTLLLALAFCFMVILYKIPVDGLSIRIESILGIIAATIIYFVSPGLSSRSKTGIAIYAISISYIISQLNHLQITQIDDISTFNWIPFAFPSNRMQYINDILLTSWVFGAISFLVISLKLRHHREVWLIGVVATGIACSSVEWQQQYLQHVSADLTIVLIAMLIWTLPFLHPEVRRAIKSKPLP